MHFLMAGRGSGNMERLQTTLESTLQTVDKVEKMVMLEAEKAGFDDENQHHIGMAVR